MRSSRNQLKFAYFRHFQRIGINAKKFEKAPIHFKSEVFAAVAVVDVKTPYYLATVARFVHQAFLTSNEGTTDESKKVLDAISKSNSICTEKIMFLTDHNVSYNRKFKMKRRRESKKKHQLDKAKQQLCTCITLFCIFLCRHCTTTT